MLRYPGMVGRWSPARYAHERRKLQSLEPRVRKSQNTTPPHLSLVFLAWWKPSVIPAMLRYLGMVLHSLRAILSGVAAYVWYNVQALSPMLPPKALRADLLSL